jgi:acyl-CoA reductase-like NAD-dependent aldehyde dehydrogenase
VTHTTLAIPEAAPSVPPTPIEVLDEAIASLRSRAAAWVALPVAEKRGLLGELVDTTLEAADGWVAAAAEAKGLTPESAHAAEDWGSGITTVVRNLRLLERTLTDIERTGRPQPPGGVRVDAEGRTVADVLPATPLDRALLAGFSAEVRFSDGVTPSEVEDRMGRIYRPGGTPEPGVTLVLGAGNVSSIGPMDALSVLFGEGRVVLLKMNPVNAHLGPHIAAAFQPLVAAGFLRIVYGGAEVGRYLTDHDGIDSIHVTGSDATYEAIVFGTGDEGAARKARGERRIDTPVTAELGNVTPVIVVPGPWSKRDLTLQGHNIASMLTQNGGFNCVAARVIVQHRAWSQRSALLDAVRSSLRDAEQRVPYYPGARDRWERFTEAHTTAERFGSDDDGAVPFTLIPQLDPAVDDDIAFTTEAFCGVMAEVELDAPRSVPDYLDAAVQFCNEQLWGTLAATIIVHPRSLADPAIAAAVERAVDELRYGSVVLNHFPGAVAYATVAPPWGAAPGSEPTDIQSGTGFVHNTFLLEDVAKVVVRGPFRVPTTPPWFHTHRRARTMLPLLAEVTARPTPGGLARLVVEAARG